MITVIRYLFCDAPGCQCNPQDCPGAENVTEARRYARQFGWRVCVVEGERKDYCPEHAKDAKDTP